MPKYWMVADLDHGLRQYGGMLLQSGAKARRARSKTGTSMKGCLTAYALDLLARRPDWLSQNGSAVSGHGFIRCNVVEDKLRIVAVCGSIT